MLQKYYPVLYLHSLFFLLFLLDCPVLAFTQKKDIITNNNDSNIYYTNFSNKLLIKLITNRSSLNLSVLNIKSSKRLELKPSDILNIGGAINYKWFGFGATFGLPNSTTQQHKEGNTSKIDLQLNIFSKFLVIDAFYQRYKGYYIKNPNKLMRWNSDTLPQLNSMSQEASSISALYVLNYKKFSFKSDYVGNIIQKKNAGSLLIGVSFTLYSAKNKDGFVNTNSTSSINSLFPLRSYSSSFLGVSVGYSHNFVFLKHYFSNLSISSTLGTNQLNITSLKTNNSIITSTTEAYNKTVFSSQVVYRMALGYQKNNYIVGLTYFRIQEDIKTKSYQFLPFTTNLKIFIAKRFGNS